MTRRQWPRPKRPLTAAEARRHPWSTEDALIYREEVVQLLFGVSDIARSLARIEALLGEVRTTKRKPTKADLEARAEMIKNADRLRELAEKAQAELDAKRAAETS